MNIKSKIFRRKSGRNKGSWIVRVQYEDESGNVRYRERHAAGKGVAGDVRDRLVEELKKSHGHIVTGDKMKFRDLADYCEKHFYKPAEYVEGRRVAGVRSLGPAKAAINALRSYFGDRPLRSIYRAAVRDYKAHRLATPIEIQVKRPEPRTVTKTRKIASVNRELTILRRMMRVALAEGWILRDPFLGADAISPADEEMRERILTREEESRLLSACRDEQKTVETSRRGKPFTLTVETRRAYLRPLIILALDTGMRRGELLKLRWADVDFVKRSIRVCATHTKTQRERLVPLTARAELELINLKGTSQDQRVFPYSDVKLAFKAAKEEAGLSDIRFHDLRHTAITRMVRGGISASETGKIAGHTQPATTYRYVNTNNETLERVAAVLDSYHQPRDSSEEIDRTASDLVN